MRIVPSKRKANIGLLTISGDINDQTALQFFMTMQELLNGGHDIRAVILRIASNGGSLGAAEAITEVLSQLKAETEAKIVTVVEDHALSAAFYIAFSGDCFFAQPSSVLGSVGALARKFDVTSLMSRLGIQDVSVCSSEAKLADSLPIATTATTARPASNLIVEELHTAFLAHIAEKRGHEVSTSPLLDGRTFTGAAGLGAGIVTALGGTVAAIRWLAQSLNLSPELLYVEATNISQMPKSSLIIRALTKALVP